MKLLPKCIVSALLLSVINIYDCNCVENISKIKNDDSKSIDIISPDYKKAEYDNLSKQYIDKIRYSKPEYSTYMQLVANIFNKLYENSDVKNELVMYLPNKWLKDNNDEIKSEEDLFKKYINITIQSDDLININKILNNLTKNTANVMTNKTLTFEDLFNYVGNKINELKINTLELLSESIMKQPDSNKDLNNELINYEKQKDQLLQEYNVQKQNKNKTNQESNADIIIDEDDNIVVDKEYGPKYEAIIDEVNNKIFDSQYNNNSKLAKELLHKYYSSAGDDTSSIRKELMNFISAVNNNQTKTTRESQQILENVVMELEQLIHKYFISKNQCSDNNYYNKTIVDFVGKLIGKYKTLVRQFDKLYYIGSKLQSRFNIFHNKLIRTLKGIQNYYKEHEIPNNTAYLYVSPKCLDYQNDMYFNNRISFKTLLNTNDDKSNQFREILKILFNSDNKEDKSYYLKFGAVVLPNIIKAINIAYDKVEQQIAESLVANHTSLGPIDPDDCVFPRKEPITCYLTIAHHLISFSRVINDPYLDYIEAFCILYDFLFLPGLRRERIYQPGESPDETIEQVLDRKDGHLDNYTIVAPKPKTIFDKRYFKLKEK